MKTVLHRVVFLAAVTAAIAGCNTEESISGTGGLAFEAAAVVAPPPAQNVQVTAKITNVSTAPLDVHYGGCVVTPVFHSGALDGPIVYDPRPGQACTAIAITKTIDPDESITLSGGAVPNLPAGKYYVEAVIAVNGETTSVGAGTVTF